MKVLVLTVGGSSEPLRTTIQTRKPERVVFICSEGSEKAARELMAELGLADLPDRGQPGARCVIVPPDDLGAVYETTRAAIDEERAVAGSTVELEGDYTGGTKSMTVGLAMAVLDAGGTLLVTTGPRTDLTKVTTGQATRRVKLGTLLVRRVEDAVLAQALDRFAYRDAGQVVRQLLSGTDLDPEHADRLERIANLCDAFDAWDRWDLARACHLLGILRGPHTSYLLALKRLIRAAHLLRSDLPAGAEPPEKVELDGRTIDCGLPIHGFEPVEDLLANAERRVADGRFDDAVGRLYRAFELTAQIALWRGSEIRTGDVDVNRVRDRAPEKADQLEANRDQRGIVRIGAWQAWELLSALCQDDQPASADPTLVALAAAFEEQRAALLGALEIRNQSLFAHGFDPIDAGRYEKLSGTVGRLLAEHLERVRGATRGAAAEALPVFPRTMDQLLGTS